MSAARDFWEHLGWYHKHLLLPSILLTWVAIALRFTDVSAWWPASMLTVAGGLSVAFVVAHMLWVKKTDRKIDELAARIREYEAKLWSPNGGDR